MQKNLRRLELSQYDQAIEGGAISCLGRPQERQQAVGNESDFGVLRHAPEQMKGPHMYILRLVSSNVPVAPSFPAFVLIRSFQPRCLCSNTWAGDSGAVDQ